MTDPEKYVRVEKIYDYANGGITTYVRAPFLASLPSLENSQVIDQVLVFGKLEQTIQYWVISNKRFTTYIPKNTKQYEFIEIPEEFYEDIEAILLS